MHKERRKFQMEEDVYLDRELQTWIAESHLWEEVLTGKRCAWCNAIWPTGGVIYSILCVKNPEVVKLFDGWKARYKGHLKKETTIMGKNAKAIEEIEYHILSIERRLSKLERKT